MHYDSMTDTKPMSQIVGLIALKYAIVRITENTISIFSTVNTILIYWITFSFFILLGGFKNKN